MFQLVQPTFVRLKHINLRQETHGKRKVSAVDLDFVCEGTAHMLSLLHEKLPGAMFFDPAAEAGQETIEGVPGAAQKLRFPRMGSFPWSDEGTGFDLTVIHGLGDERSNLEFSDGKAGTKRVDLLADGCRARIHCRYSTCVIPDGALDKLRDNLDQAIEIMLVQNERLREECADVIDGTTEAFKRDHPLFEDGPEDSDEDGEGDQPDATDAFVEAHAEAAEPPPEFVNDNPPEAPGSGRRSRKTGHDITTAH